MTSPSRVLAILGLFSEQRPVWHTDDVIAALQYTRATGYRYVKDLVEAGLLQKVAGGRYALGARIIELDYQLRRSDPVLLAAVPVMEALSKKARLDTVLTTLFGMRVIDTHRVSANPTLQLGYGRGRPRPLFKGAAPKVMLSCTSRPQLVRIYAAHAAQAKAAGLGASWNEFRVALSDIRKRGFYWSEGELDKGVAGAAVPILNADAEALAALALVGSVQALRAVGELKMTALLTRARDEIQAGLVLGATPPRGDSFRNS